MAKQLPLLALTTGDPLGIGPEVMVKALVKPEATSKARLLGVGSVGVLERTAEQLGVPVRFNPVDSPGDARFKPGELDVMELGLTGLEHLAPGQVEALAGKASVDYVIRAAELALAGEVDGVVTGPIHKEAVQAGGYSQYIGNTEILEDVCTRHTGHNYHGQCMTMLITKNLRVAHATRHIPFRDIASHLTEKRLTETVLLTAAGMTSLGFPQARIAVAGLNPHNGEHGMIGREEVEMITPLLKKLRESGLNVVGPVPADSIFFKAIAGEYDAVIALYHDQGHIAIKVHGFEESITVSLGLPVIRTSVDHGTAFDIVGQGIASEKGMVAALELAAQVVEAGTWNAGLRQSGIRPAAMA